MAEKYYVSKERLEELTEELSNLKTQKRREVAERLKQAKEYGDLSENSEYTEARNQQEIVEKRIFELEDFLKHVVVIKKDTRTDVISIGSIVTAKKGKEIFTYHIVGISEARPEAGKISNESPLGKMLLGRKVGDSVQLSTPAKEIVEYHIIKVE